MIPESLLHRLQHSIVEQKVIFSVESIIGALVSLGIPPDKILIQHSGSAKRTFRQAVTGFHLQSSGEDNDEFLYIHTSEKGLYDSLPENIFHQPSSLSYGSVKFEAIAEISRRKAEEKNARKFFLPFDDVIAKSKSILYARQEDFEKSISNHRLIALFSEHWPVIKKLDADHAYVFIRVIPLIHDIRDDFTKIPLFIKTVLGVPINCTLQKRRIFQPSYDVFTMGNGFLGEDMIIGMEVDDGDPDVVITIGPLNEQQVHQYSPGSFHDKLLDELLDYVIGANYFIYKEIELADNNHQFMLDGDTVLLGINAVL